MSIKDIKIGDILQIPDTVSLLGAKKFEWVKQPTYKQRPPTLYGIRVEDEDGNSVPFIAHPKPYKDTLN